MPENDISNSVALVRQLVSTQYFAVLSTDEKGQPYTNLVAFAAADDLKSLVFVTSRKTRKYRNIVENHRVSLLIDSRTNQITDITQAVAVTVIGVAYEGTVNRSSLRNIFLARHPHLSQFVDDPESAMIEVKVSEFIVAGFKKTQRIIITS